MLQPVVCVSRPVGSDGFCFPWISRSAMGCGSGVAAANDKAPITVTTPRENVLDEEDA